MSGNGPDGSGAIGTMGYVGTGGDGGGPERFGGGVSGIGRADSSSTGVAARTDGSGVEEREDFESGCCCFLPVTNYF